LPDGREFWSKSSWHRSEISDVGFIQLKDKPCQIGHPDDISEKLPISYPGNSSGLRKGDDVFIVGCPFGYELRFTVTKGIVSGFKRDFGGYFGKKMLIQVDAQSWPGNSGGPVYDMRGQIAGILVGGYYGADGIGLVVPVDTIKALFAIYKAERYVEGIE
jgi:S1-C subfamily serine protease